MIKWEMFCDPSYYDMWAVRKIEDQNFNSPTLFHFNLRTEAERLLNYLNKEEKIREEVKEHDRLQTLKSVIDNARS